MSIELKNANTFPATSINEGEGDFYRQLVESGLSLLSIENNLQKLLQEVVALALTVTKADAGSLYVIQGKEIEFTVARNLTLEERRIPMSLEHFRLPINNNTICGYVAGTGESLFIDDANNLDAHLPFRFNRSFDIKFNYTSQSMLALPLTNAAGQVVGVLQLINHRLNGLFVPFPRYLLSPVRIMARKAGMALYNAILSDNLKKSQYETVYRLSIAAEARDKSTGMHVHRVSEYARILANAMGQPEEFQELIHAAAPLHDVGKIGITDSILQKPGSLTPEEREVMKTHTTLGFSMLNDSESPLLKLGASIALTHHEKWDGTGYPHGLQGESIPLEGRLIALADVFDALVSRRCYKAAMPIDQIKALITNEKGRHFDPVLTEKFLDSWDEINRTAEQMKD